MLTPKDIMEILVSVKTLRIKMVRQKGFPSIKVGNRYVVRESSLRNGLKRTKVENLFYLKEKFEIT